MRTKKLGPMPVSRARTAYGLCKDVKRVILEQPRRIDMNRILEKATAQRAGGPPCGTVGCFAGWVIALYLGGVTSYEADNVATGEARQILGPSVEYSFGINQYVFNDGAGDACATTKPGTKAHALAVASRIDQFMEYNETALKARTLPPRSKRKREFFGY